MQYLTWCRTTFPRAFWGIRLAELKPFAFPLTPQQPLPSVLLSPESPVISKCFFLFGKDRTFLLHPLKAKTCCFLAPALKHTGTEDFQSNSFGWQRRFRCGPGTACIRSCGPCASPQHTLPAAGVCWSQHGTAGTWGRRGRGRRWFLEGPPHPFRLEEVGKEDATIQAAFHVPPAAKTWVFNLSKRERAAFPRSVCARGSEMGRAESTPADPAVSSG